MANVQKFPHIPPEAMEAPHNLYMGRKSRWYWSSQVAQQAKDPVLSLQCLGLLLWQIWLLVWKIPYAVGMPPNPATPQKKKDVNWPLIYRKEFKVHLRKEFKVQMPKEIVNMF